MATLIFTLKNESREKVYAEIIFQHDNTRLQMEQVAMNCLQANPILLLPARSADLSPIDHIWDVLGRRLQLSRNIDRLAIRDYLTDNSAGHHPITLKGCAMPVDNMKSDQRWKSTLLASSLCNRQIRK